MADDSAGQAIEIVGALHEAGLLRAAGARTSSEPAAQIITALSEAGLFGTPPSSTSGEPAAVGVGLAPAAVVAEPEPKVDDEAYLGDVRRITRMRGQVILSNYSPPRWIGDYVLNFPPNIEDWLLDIDKIIAAPRQGLFVDGAVKITEVPDASRRAYVGRLTELRPTYTLR